MVEEGTAQWKKVIDEFYKPFAKEMELAEKEIGNVEIKDEVSDVPCDKCGTMMVYKMSKFGKFLACPAFPKCRNTKTIVKEIGIKCPDCNGEIIEKKSRRGKLFYGCTNFPNCEFTSWYKPTDKKCDKCGNILFEKSGRSKGTFCQKCDVKEK